VTRLAVLAIGPVMRDADAPAWPPASGWVAAAVVLVAAAAAREARATDFGGATGVSAGVAAGPARRIDSREVIVPVPGAERMRIDNPLGNVVIRAWDRTDAIHIVAEKQSASAEALARLRVHFTAWAGGEVSVETRVELGGRERAMPLEASRIDLVVEVPANLEIEAKTFAGDLSASGLRSGARLETTGGRIGVSDVRGRVTTHQLRGGQTVAAVEGDVNLEGVEGNLTLERIAGARVEARVDGDIRAADLRSSEVRLATTTGQVVLLGVLRPHAHYDLRSYSGEVRLALVRIPGAVAGPVAADFELRVRSPAPLQSEIPLRVLWRRGDRLRAIVAMAGARAAGRADDDRPVVELASVLGRVLLTAPQPADGR
jgi:hypothetical protein